MKVTTCPNENVVALQLDATSFQQVVSEASVPLQHAVQSFLKKWETMRRFLIQNPVRISLAFMIYRFGVCFGI
jgi:hypothetical protein